MTKENIFITGASGCIGHYILDHYLEATAYNIHLILRNPKRLRFDVSKYPHIHVHVGNIEEISPFKSLLSTMDYVFHIATNWNNSDYATLINRDRTEEMFSYLDEKRCKKIVYFSTASILGPDNQPVPEAESEGTGYVRSKYLAYEALPNMKLADKVVTVFPTLVFGGDKTHPFSHISEGLPNVKHYLKYTRFLDIDGGFHFLHAFDIAQVAVYLCHHQTDNQAYVLGVSPIAINKAMKTLCTFFNVRRYFTFPVRPWFILGLAKLLRIEMHDWDRYCISHPHMVYESVCPDDFGLTTKYPDLIAVLKTI